MKHLLPLLVVLLVFTACTTRHSSMLRQLQELEARCNDYDAPISDSAALKVVAYMERCGNAEERQAAWRMLSRVYYRKGWGFYEESAYGMAVGCIDTTQAFDTLAFAHTLYEWSQCLNRSLDYDQSRQQVERAMRYALAAGDTVAAMRFYSDICPDSAYRYLWNRGEKALAADASLPYIEQLWLHGNNKAKLDSAWLLLERYARDTPSNLTHRLSYEAADYWLLRGKLLAARHEYDSAFVYLRKVKALGEERREQAQQAIFRMGCCYDAMGQKDSASRYYSTNLSYTELAAHRLMNDRFKSRFHDYQIQHHNMEMRNEAERLHLILLTASLIAIIAVALGLYRYTALRHRHRETLQQNREYAEMLQMLRSHKVDDNFDVLAAPIVERFHHLSSQDMHPSAEEWQELQAFVLSVFPQLFPTLSAQHALSDQEQRVVSLIAIKCTPLQMSVLLVCTKSNVSNLRRRLYVRLTNTDGSGADLDRLVANLCTNNGK